MKNTVLIFTVVVALLIGFTADSRADMCGKCSGMGMGIREKMPEMGPGMCGNCMAMSGEGPMMGAGVMEMIKHLELDEKQASAFKAVHLKMKKESIQKRAELQIAELELMELRSSDPVDLMAAEAKIRQIEALRSGLRISHLRTHEGVKGMLTPEQKVKLDSFMETGTGGAMGRMRHCRMMGNMGSMGGMGRVRQMEESDMQRGDGSEGHDMQPD
jgi:Spy/CpxP family protein refolding chaperone